MHSLFGTKHLIILVVCAALIVFGAIATRKWDLKKLVKAMLAVGIVSEFIKVFYYIMANEAKYGGILPKTDLPFHLCSIQIIFLAALTFSSNEKLKELLLSFMLPSGLFGGIAALLIATTSSLNGQWILSVQYFGYHLALVIFALSLFRSNILKRTFKHYVNCLKFLAVLLLCAIYINSILYDGVSNINFMYVASPPVSGLPFLTEKYGWAVYMAHYGFLVLFCITLCYIKPIITAIREKFSGAKQKSAV